VSLDQPNEYEQAIEDYGAAVRREEAAKQALDAATEEHTAAHVDRQAAWRRVSAYVNEGHIEPGIYRLNRGPGTHADGILIERHHDYPDLFPMFR
jgi:hypothetical protein